MGVWSWLGEMNRALASGSPKRQMDDLGREKSSLQAPGQRQAE